MKLYVFGVTLVLVSHEPRVNISNYGIEMVADLELILPMDV